MHIILRLICEILSIMSEISFLWGRKHGIHVYAGASFAASVTSWYLCSDMQKFTSVILYMKIIFIAQWLLGADFEILHCYGALAQSHKLFKLESTFKQTCVDSLPWKKASFLNYITATLGVFFAWHISYFILA